MLLRQILILSVAANISACAFLQRSSDSGYASGPASSSGTQKDYLRDRESRKTAYELGIDPSSPLSHEEQALIENRIQLKKLEKNLSSKKEREQYSKILPWLRNDREKIEFLSVPGLEGRQQWINAKGVWNRARLPLAEMKDLIETQDIAVGMPQDYVKKSWGEPQKKEVSGNPIYKNERWHYQRYISSAEGFKQENRLVYFEGGRVVGWETE